MTAAAASTADESGAGHVHDDSEAHRPKTKITVQIADGLSKRARATVAGTNALPGEPPTLTDFIARAIERACEASEQAHNGGQPFDLVRRLPTGPRPSTDAGRRRRQRASRTA